MKSLCRMITAGIMVSVLSGLSGCSTPKPTHTVRFYPEARSSADNFTRTLKMPLSGLEFNVLRKPVIWEEQILQVDMVKVASGDLALRFVFDDFGTRELYRQSASNLGGRMVLVINEVPLGARQFDGPITDGVYFTFMEMSPAEMEQLTLDLQENIKRVQELKR